MEHLIREQKIERRIAKNRRDLYTTTSSIKRSDQGTTIKLTPSLKAFTTFGTPDKITLRSTARSVPVGTVGKSGYVLGRMLRAFADRIISQAMNTDICYIASIFIAILALSLSLQPTGAIINHTLQPAVFHLPQVDPETLPVHFNSQAVELPSEEYDSDLFQTFRVRKYIVQNGQTISELAQLHDISMSTLISFNQISNARTLQAGSVYSVPDREGVLHVVKAGESIEQIAERYNVDVNTLLDVNNLASASLESDQQLFVPGIALEDFDLRLALGELFIRPTYGRLTSGYGYRADPFTGVRRFHYGIDIAAPTGSPILAAMEGTVSYIGEQSRGYGKYIILRHPGGFQSLYAHLNGFNVRRGQYVSRGQTIGWMGNTGRSTGTHLHFSIIRNGKFVSPSSYLY